MMSIDFWIVFEGCKVHNNALHRTAISLRSIAAGELSR